MVFNKRGVWIFSLQWFSILLLSLSSRIFCEQQVNPPDLDLGVFGGPVVLLDGGDAVTFGSVADHAKHWASHQNNSRWSLGPSSELLEIPAGTTFRTSVAARTQKPGRRVLTTPLSH